MKLLKAIQLAHDDLQQYSATELDLMRKKYLEDINLKELDRNDLAWLLAITLILGRTHHGHMDVDIPDRGTVDISKKCLKGYEIKQLLGKGSSGAVFAACLEDDCSYAVKIMNVQDEEAEADFQRETMITDELSLEGIGPEYIGQWLCKDQQLGLIVTEKWDGSLLDLQTAERCILISEQLLDKLLNQIKKIHQMGYLHLDILPKNILYKKDQHAITDVTLTDFGILKEELEFINNTELSEDMYIYHMPQVGEFYRKYNIEHQDILRYPKLLDYGYITYLKECNNLPTPEYVLDTKQEIDKLARELF